MRTFWDFGGCDEAFALWGDIPNDEEGALVGHDVRFGG
jgi:hypothetical protein